MKKIKLIAGGIFLTIAILFMLFTAMPAASAACYDNSQIIMKLSSATNAHAELADQNNYNDLNANRQICYNDIFGSVYAGANPQACTGGNRIARLSSKTNAHAQIPTLVLDGSITAYSWDVCYGNLVCASRSACQSGEAEVISLSSETNAHLASDGSYSTKICCSGAEPSEIVTCTDTSIIGDANADTSITPGDANSIYNIVLGIISSPSNKCCVDVDNDGSATARDALFVFNHYLGINDPLNSGATGTTSGGCLIGDANNDGSIAVADAELIFNAYLGLALKDNCHMDINSDGSITPGDSLYVYNYVLGVAYDNIGKKCNEVPAGDDCTASEAGLCDDGIDNDCDGEQDYDYDYADSLHGDSDCPLSVTAISVSESNPTEYTNINVYCTSSVAGVNSIDAYIGSMPKCTWDSWAGDVASFTCNVGSYIDDKTVRCTVDPTKSYQSGNDKTASINVLPSACSGYSSSSSCDSDSACDWCNACSGTKSSRGSDRCVSAGSCSYSCWKGECGAGCDETQGGWTDYDCDNYCSSGAIYLRSDIFNSCQDDCMPTTDSCADGTATFCGTTSCASPAVGSCDNTCNEAGTPTDGADATCGACTPTCTTLGAASWENLNSQAISSAEINDTAKLIINGSELAGKNINFTVYKDGGGCGLLWMFDCEIAQLSSTAQSNLASTTWKIDRAGVLYFKANIIETGQEVQSGSIDISSTDDNTAPVAVLNSPENGARFEINTPISFAQSSYDIDDDISIAWNFDDGNTTTFANCLTGGNCNTSHTYTSGGTKNVIITATDARGRTDTDFASIDIFQGGVDVFSRISKPQPNDIIQGSGWVFFNASSSYAANCSSASCPVNGAGNCYTVGSLQCRNLNQNNLMLNWTFDDGTIRYGTWQSNYSYAVEFNKFFSSVGVHNAALRAGYP